VAVAEGRDLHRDREGGAQPFAELGLVHDDDEGLGARLDHLLPQQGPAAALDQVQVAVHVVGPVDRHVQLASGDLVQRAQRDAQRLRLLLRAHLTTGICGGGGRFE
jgi:hypothetical protein